MAQIKYKNIFFIFLHYGIYTEQISTFISSIANNIKDLKNTNYLKEYKNIRYGRMVPSGSSPYISPTEIKKKATSPNYFSVGIKTPIERTPPPKIVIPGEK